MIVKLEAKSRKLGIKLELTPDTFTESVLKNPKYSLNKRLEAVAVGLRSELLMFLMEIEKETDLT